MSGLDNNAVVLAEFWTKAAHQRHGNRYGDVDIGIKCNHPFGKKPKLERVEEKSTYRQHHHPTLLEENKETLNPFTKQWRESLRTFEKSSYEERTYRKPVESPTPTTTKEDKPKEQKSTKQNGKNKQKKSKGKKAVRWSKKS